MAEQAACPQEPIIQHIKRLAADIITLKELLTRYPQETTRYGDLIFNLTKARDAEFVTLGRDAFARLAGSVENERR
jgi:hypothetical protein